MSESQVRLKDVTETFSKCQSAKSRHIEKFKGSFLFNTVRNDN